MGLKSKVTLRNAYPKAGVEQFMISQDFIHPMGLRLEKDMVKAVEAVDRAMVQCQGSAAISITYQG